MAVTLEEMKNYLRVDYDEDDALIESIIGASERLCMDVARMDSLEEFSAVENAKVSVLYAAAYLYEHREEADHRALTLTLRALLFGEAEVPFCSSTFTDSARIIFPSTRCEARNPTCPLAANSSFRRLKERPCLSAIQ